MKSRSSKAVLAWIFLLVTMIYLMVIVGGLTRLTNSGLSMVDWKPLTGTIPPLNDAQWSEVFAKYQNFPEYQKVNEGMSLEEVQIHILLGVRPQDAGSFDRYGVLFFPLFSFVTGRVKGYYAFKLFIAFILGGAQGLLGWYMVKSGLVNEPHVSHYRLAANGISSYLFGLFLMTEIWPNLGEVNPIGINLN